MTSRHAGSKDERQSPMPAPAVRVRERDMSRHIDPSCSLPFLQLQASYQILGTVCVSRRTSRARTSPEAETLAAARRRAHVQCSMLQRVSLLPSTAVQGML